MRILAALTLLTSVLLSPFCHAGPFELQWEFEVSSNRLLRGYAIVKVDAIKHTPDGGCVVRLELTDPANNIIREVVFVLTGQGTLRWVSEITPPNDSSISVYVIEANNLVIRLGWQPQRLVAVNLNSGEETDLPAGYGFENVPSYGWDGNGTFFLTNGLGSGNTPLPGRVTIQKWAPASPTPNLAPSTFGIEDGNLIISWPTAAGQTYQVQRSTDLESWENIGVALTGNGTTMSYAQPSNADKVFLRV